MNPFVVLVAEVALAHQVNHGDVTVGEGEEFVAEENCVWVVMKVEVVDSEIV